jgi:hexulose-6-phosphate isomerase
VNAIGIMQGRLSPPGARPQTFPMATWRDEFAQAQACGFDSIEWLISAADAEHNPLLLDAATVSGLAADSGVAVQTICADCFIERPFTPSAAGSRDGVALLRRIAAGAAAVGAGVVTVPMLEGNAVASATELRDALATIASVRVDGVRIAIECDLPAVDLLAAIAGGDIAVCYDLGNAAAIGRDSTRELLALGDRVAVVHVKDRRRDGPSVPLGTGDVDFQGAFAALSAIGFAGPCILETPRGKIPLDAAARHLEFVRQHLAGSRALA